MLASQKHIAEDIGIVFLFSAEPKNINTFGTVSVKTEVILYLNTLLVFCEKLCFFIHLINISNMTWKTNSLKLSFPPGRSSAISKISKVFVKAGASISIPCLYDAQYKNNVKYLCKGYYWNTCSYAVKTNSPDGSGKYLISDSKRQSIFNVTIKQLRVDNAHYWCAVEIGGGADVKQYFQLSVTKGEHQLWHLKLLWIRKKLKYHNNHDILILNYYSKKRRTF